MPPDDFYSARHLNILDEIYLSARELAEHINSKVRTIENWAAARNIQQNEQGKYGLISAFKFQLEKLRLDLGRVKLQLSETKEELEGHKDDLGKDAFEARNRKAIAEADKEEALAGIKQLELSQLEGKLVDAEAIETEWANLITTCVAKFSQLPAKLALQLSGMDTPEEIQQLLTEVIYECLSELGDLSNFSVDDAED